MRPEPDELADAFAELRHRAVHTFTAPAAEQIYDAAHARTERTRRFSITAALLAATGLMTATMVLQAPPETVDREPLASGQVWTPPVEAPWVPLPDPPQTSAGQTGQQPGQPNQPPAATRADLANQVRFLPEEKTTQLRDATITLPPWPVPSQACVAGTFTFRDGKAPTGVPDPIGRPFDYLMLLGASQGIYANLDGTPGDEMVVPIACGFTEVTYQLLVLEDDRDGPHAVGYLPGLPAFDRFYPYETGLVVEILNGPFDTVAEQRRRYGWNGTRFLQTHGPGAFPADLFPDPRRTDLRQSYFRIDQCGGGMLSFLDGVSGTWPHADRDNPGDTHPATRFELGEISTGLLNEPPEPAGRGDALVTVTCKPDGRPHETWVVKVSAAQAVPVLKVGVDGVDGVVSHRITGAGLAEVVVKTQTRQQIWHYRSDGHNLIRIP